MIETVINTQIKKVKVKKNINLRINMITVRLLFMFFTH